MDDVPGCFICEFEGYGFHDCTNALDTELDILDTSHNCCPNRETSPLNASHDVAFDHDYTELSNLSAYWSPLLSANSSDVTTPLSPFLSSSSRGFGSGSSCSWTSDDCCSSNCDNVFDEDIKVLNSPGFTVQDSCPEYIFDEKSQDHIEPLDCSMGSLTESPKIELLSEDLSIWVPRRRDKVSKDRKKPGRKPGQVSSVYHLWEYLVDSLFDPEMNPPAIKWTEKHKGVFQINDTKELSKRWGMVKKNKNMTYEKMSRALRHSIKVGYLQRVPKKMGYPKKLCYMFGPKAHGWNADLSKYMEEED